MRLARPPSAAPDSGAVGSASAEALRPGARHLLRRSLAPLAVGLSVSLSCPPEALADALVRFIHGVPGVGRADVSIGHGSADQAVGSIAFGQVTPWRAITTGGFNWALASGGKTLAGGTARVGNGAYDLVVLQKMMKVWIGAYLAQPGRPGMSLVRVIHGAPELGSPALDVDGKQIAAHVAYTQATPYLRLTPGHHTLSAMKPGASTALVTSTVDLKAGVSYSAVVLGSRGQRLRVILLVDRGGPAVKPSGSPSPTKRSRTPAAAGPGTLSSSTYRIRVGDSLWSIARRRLAPGSSNGAIAREVAAIWQLNATRIGSGDPNLIFPGTTLHLPAR